MNFWNQRYSEEGFAYGSRPNEYLKHKLRGLKAGKILFPAEGEGRNAVYAASLGWESTACDLSETGKIKAEALARSQNLKVDYQLCNVAELDFEKESFDALALIYAHFHENQRRKIHRDLVSFLKPGGYLILEAFSKDHLVKQKDNPGVGGPQNEIMLYDLEEIKEDFNAFEFLEAEKSDIALDEGKYHVGEASVVRIFARKRAEF